jgi:hypothetical protein
MKPTIGRIVHFVQKRPAPYGDGTLVLPAIVVAVWGDTCVNLQVFTDSGNSEGGDNGNLAMKWITSVSLDESADPAPRTWHWPERV